MVDNLDFLTIAEAARHLRARDISALELVDHLLARIEALDPQINSFITVTGELARRQASIADAEITHGRWRGPLHGIPVGLKDIYSTAGILTSGHSKVGMDNVPNADATSVAKLYDAGAVLMGKLSTHEFAHGGPSFDLPWPPARNPWDPSRSAGGSSSGSGAAVAAGFVLGAMGSDTGGSVRVPAARSGVAGLKPTYGLISRRGVINNSFSFDHCGPLAWTVEDCALMLQAVAGFDVNDPGSAEREVPDYAAAFVPDLEGWRIGVVRHFWEEDLPGSEEERAAMNAALDVFRGLGATLEDVRLRSLQEYFDVKIIVAESEIHSVHQRDLQGRPGDFGADFMGKILLASLFSASDYVQAQRTRRQMLEEMEPIYARYDVLVTAGMSPAPRFEDVRIIDFWEKPNMTTPFSVTAGPALSLCNGYTGNALPMSMQIVGRPFDEIKTLRAGYAYERATAWRQRRPRLMPGVARVSAGPSTDNPTDPSRYDARTRQLVDFLLARHGLTKVSDAHIAQLCEAVPYGLAMAERVRRGLRREDEPANSFRFPRSTVGP